MKIPDSVKNIEHMAFYGCIKLTSVTIPDSVTSIGKAAFRGCVSLRSVTIGSGIERIEKLAFSKCDELENFIFKGKTEDEVRSMENYPWSSKIRSVIKCEP